MSAPYNLHVVHCQSCAQERIIRKECSEGEDWAQAQYDPAMRARMENGSNMHSRSKGAFGFKMPFAE